MLRPLSVAPFRILLDCTRRYVFVTRALARTPETDESAFRQCKLTVKGKPNVMSGRIHHEMDLVYVEQE
jgi:hypothetical protein